MFYDTIRHLYLDVLSGDLDMPHYRGILYYTVYTEQSGRCDDPWNNEYPAVVCLRNVYDTVHTCKRALLRDWTGDPYERMISHISYKSTVSDL